MIEPGTHVRILPACNHERDGKEGIVLQFRLDHDGRVTVRMEEDGKIFRFRGADQLEVITA